MFFDYAIYIMLLRHEFQEPFGEDVSELLADLSKQYNDGAVSYTHLDVYKRQFYTFPRIIAMSLISYRKWKGIRGKWFMRQSRV